ncbi:hypothetical protein EXIGLDRAFT_415880 [Exidia glandulosa HHB12029]|uniref:Uncharacterized protein n=1 Tax=Exidia glandulosa HHB12029 TaxID=1314781 RepID=A0A165PRU8_EXIGL|nr:hypothetical protein EXIGLDRAFT_415880 [Exidia glandulosa HHB12029]
MFFKTALLVVPVAATTVFAVAYPAPLVTPAPAVRAEPRNIIDDATSAIGNEINSIKDGINSAAHWGSSVLDNGKTIIKDDAGQVLTLADNEASTIVTLGGAVYTVASTSYASATDKVKAQESSMSASASATGSNG